MLAILNFLTGQFLYSQRKSQNVGHNSSTRYFLSPNFPFFLGLVQSFILLFFFLRYFLQVKVFSSLFSLMTKLSTLLQMGPGDGEGPGDGSGDGSGDGPSGYTIEIVFQTFGEVSSPVAIQAFFH